MQEKETRFPNVSLKGKLNKQKGDTDPEQLRYGQKNQTEGSNRK
jgi:hypothetical protein